MDLKQDFLDKVKSRSVKLGLTPQAVCVAADMSQALWDNWITGRNDPSLDAMQRICTTLDDIECVRSTRKTHSQR